ncbi:hypothetical protein C5167_029806 [Papaver somniferum]|uniref:L-type lectin-domain containing receptor kinase IX.1-like n=1 Tax=Papaver somniferum TaxID=3469 RepID=UPI000E6FEE58|nr:L-type lectin-domain containing receptor kinase IX.1-like [Papaver somniferum]RZC87254.1 hypothetical protein C5167_029806 [Papaver somniferum]
MGFHSKSSTNFHLHSSIFIFQIITVILLLPTPTNSISFNYPDFATNDPRINFQGDATRNSSFIELTSDSAGARKRQWAGRATYSEAIQLWDKTTGRQTDFDTHFSFIMDDGKNETEAGDGLTFFLAPFGSVLPPVSWGGALGLLTRNISQKNLATNQIVAVEFDSYEDEWDPSSDHVGINVNSVVSEATALLAKGTIKNGRKANAWVSYKSATKNLSVHLTYADNPVFSGRSTLYHVVDLSKVLPERITVGFSAAVNWYSELHRVLSWQFNSTLELTEVRKDNKTGERETDIIKGKGNNITALVVGLGVAGLGVLGCGFGFSLFIWCKKRRSSRKFSDDAANSDVSMDDAFEKGTGPKRFSYSELANATNNFDEGGKLGQGGFGGVYKGFLSDKSLDFAVKRISSESKQGKKEYQSEVKIISQLRHRNLVQLIGWCHERNELLLVYEFMPYRSLDKHLFKGENVLTWEVRYNIALGLASALLYLHEAWEQCVVHRDIKSSNIMLDSKFNAKLGDFGLARFVDHEVGSQTTVLAGTMGYLAPESVATGKSSKESDVYAFGIVALELACGRKPIDASKELLLEWVWKLYGCGKVIEAADDRLCKNFDEQQMEQLLVLGLCCAHPNHTNRPSIRKAFSILNFESHLPVLPSKLPTPEFYASPVHMCRIDSQTDGSQGTCSCCSNTNLSQITMSSSGSASKSLLNSGEI